MRALSATEILDVWERGLAQRPIERSLALLAAACAESPVVMARLSVGRRDRLLLKLREWTFGRQLAATEICSACGERLELNFSVADITAEPEAELNEIPPLIVAEYQLRCRAINSQDLIAIAEQRDPASARRQLLERCLSEICRDGASVSVDQLPEGVISAVAERLQQADPQANVQLALTCPQCGYEWRRDFDIGPFFWNEIHAWAQRILREVHALASAYGWRENDILMMSPQRRQFYLNCIGR